MINPSDYIVEEPWFQVDVPRQEFRSFMERNNYRGIIDTLIWFTCLGLSGYLAYTLIGSAWAIPAFFLYGVFYCAADARWHESSHGTVFKVPWLNTVLCFIATAMQQRDIIFTHWSHTRHHSYTVINDIDPEITVTRPPTFWEHFLNFWSLGETKYYVPILIQHALGIVSKDAKKFVPEEEFSKMFWWARASLIVNIIPIALAIYLQSWLPVLFFGLPKLYGNILQRAFVLAQHAGLDDDTWDHRKNCRTIKVNPFLGFLYMNMQYHIEHHMNPLMPFHQLPKFSARIKDQLPIPYNGMIEVYKEMLPALRKQVDDPTYFIKREVPTLPEDRRVKRIKALSADDAMVPMAAGDVTLKGANTAANEAPTTSVKATNNDATIDVNNVDWKKAVAASELGLNDAINVCIDGNHYAVYQLDNAGEYYATDGICSHEHAYLADGFIEGGKVLCPKHNSRFCIKTGEAMNRPAKTPIKTYPVKVEGDDLLVGVPA